MSCPYEPSVAAYALGTLDAGERPDVAAHLASCPACGRAHDGAARLRRLLSQVAVDDLDVPAPGPGAVDRLLEQAGAQRRRRARRLLAAAAAVLVFATGTASAALLRRPDAGTWTVQAVQGPVRATITLDRAGDGTGFALRMSGVRPGDTCRLVVVADDGRRDVATTWRAGYTGEVVVRGRTAVPQDRLARLVVESTDGRTYVDVTVDR